MSFQAELEQMQALDFCRFIDAEGLQEKLEGARAASLRVTREKLSALMREQVRLCVKDELTPGELASLAPLREHMRDHPVTLPFSLLVLVFDDRVQGEMADWMPEYLQEQTWEWLWWANRMDETLDQMMVASVSWAKAAVVGSKPYPDGWLPESRRKV